MRSVVFAGSAWPGLVLALLVTPAFAQEPTLPTRTIKVGETSMRVWTEGLEHRQPGKPVVVLEAGAGAGLETWRPVFAEISKRAPVVAYDRRGIGQSQEDSERPTLRRVAASLHALLDQLGAAPPYVLVGHSWGAAFIRAFADAHGSAVAGMVFLDATDIETTRQEKATVVPEVDRANVLAPPTFPPFPPEMKPGERAEAEEIKAEMIADYPTTRSFRQPVGIPVGVIVSTPPGRLTGNGAAVVRLQINKQSEWALKSSNGVFITAGHVGHQVHRDDPPLVVALIDHVLKHAQ